MNQIPSGMIDEITQDLALCGSLEKLGEATEKLICSVGAKQYVYHSYIASLTEVNSLTNIKRAWIKQYQENNYRLFDPRILYLVRHTEPTRWKDIRLSSGSTGELQRKILAEAARHGLAEGVTIPVHGAGADVASLSLSAPAGELPEYSATDLCVLKILTHEINNSFRRIRLGRDTEANRDFLLTTRESEVVSWTAQGKTAWEISQILSCSESTVLFHLKNVSKKLNTSNRVHTVAKLYSDAHMKQFAELDHHQQIEISENSFRIS